MDQSGSDLGQLDLHIDTVLKSAKKEVKNLQRAENESQGVAQKDKLIAKLTNAADEAIREIEDRESAIESSNLGEDDLDSPDSKVKGAVLAVPQMATTGSTDGTGKLEAAPRTREENPRTSRGRPS